jgi:hypothetical protein
MIRNEWNEWNYWNYWNGANRSSRSSRCIADCSFLNLELLNIEPLNA